ncbi:MAG: hypothetical protein WAQ45_08970, partial [Trichococcus flocculiformis]
MKIMPRLRCLSAPTRIVYNIRKNKRFADQESEMEPGGICMGDGLKRLIQAAQQLEEADLIIQNGTVVDVFSLETFEADVAIRDGRIVGIGTYPNGKQVVDATGKFILPGFIDGHI